LATFIAQGFFATRVWSVSHNAIVTAMIELLSINSFVFSLVVADKLFVTKLTSRLPELVWAMITSLASAAACDIFITLVLCLYLHRSRTGFK